MINVPKNNTIDMRKTFGTGSRLSQSTPTRVPFSACQIKFEELKTCIETVLTKKFMLN